MRALAICERKRLLFFEFLSKLERIREEYGPGAEFIELCLQAAISDEQAARDKEEAEAIKRKAGRR